MYQSGWEGELARERIADARAEAERRRLARLAAGPRITLRVRAARMLFDAVVILARGLGEAGGAEPSVEGEGLR